MHSVEQVFCPGQCTVSWPSFYLMARPSGSVSLGSWTSQSSVPCTKGSVDHPSAHCGVILHASTKIHQHPSDFGILHSELSKNTISESLLAAATRFSLETLVLVAPQKADVLASMMGWQHFATGQLVTELLFVRERENVDEIAQRIRRERAAHKFLLDVSVSFVASPLHLAKIKLFALTVDAD